MRDLLRALRSYATLLLSLAVYAVSGRTPERGLHAMIHAHALTNGWTTAVLASLFRVTRPPRRADEFRQPADLFARLEPPQMDAIVRGLRDEGYAISPLRIPAAIVERLRKFAEVTPGHPWNANGKIGELRVYDRADRNIAKFQFEASVLAGQPEVQELAADSGLLEIAQRNLRCLPVLDSIAMWWSTPHLEHAADEIAQTFHIDYDRVRWLKVFIYLTDVTPESGPHVFVRHSHLREVRRAQLIGRGYVRLPDKDVERVYRADEIVSVCGPAGTVLFEDTSGFHKGTMPAKHERLILEYQFSCNLFGANYPPMHLALPMGEKLAAARRRVAAAYPMFT